MSKSTAPSSAELYLDGFEYVPSDGIPFITLDSQRRFYLNASARKLIGIKPYDRVSVAYNATESALAVVKQSSDAHASMSLYLVDKRYYMSARKFASTYAYGVANAPYEFVYERGSSDGNVFVFKLRR